MNDGTLKKRGILDHDIFVDRSGRIYFVLGHYQPQDRVISILKYIPDPGGTWKHRGTGITYTRSYWHQGVEVLLNTESLVKGTLDQLHSWWVRDPILNMDFLEVPLDQIHEYLVPEARLAGICKSSDATLDPLESKVKHVATTLNEEFKASRITLNDVGITGSILWNGHSERSDININVYGKRACIALNEALLARALESPSIAPGLTVTLKGFHDVPFLALDKSLPDAILSRKPKLKMVDFTPGIQMRWCLRRGEFPITYGRETYHLHSVQQFKLRVTDDEYALFYPALVGVETVEGPLDVSRMMIYDTRLTRFFKKNDVFHVTATVQEVLSYDGDVFYQILIGSKDHAGDEKVILINADSGT